MPEHSFRCQSCGKTTRILFSLEQHPYPDVARCAACGNPAVRYFERAPGMQPDIWNPTFDVQAGRAFSSRRQRDEWLKSKGLGIISTEEFDRNVLPREHPDEIAWDSERWHEAAKKAHDDIYYGNVEVPAPPSLDEADQPIITVGKE